MPLLIKNVNFENIFPKTSFKYLKKHVTFILYPVSDISSTTSRFCALPTFLLLTATLQKFFTIYVGILFTENYARGGEKTPFNLLTWLVSILKHREFFTCYIVLSHIYQVQNRPKIQFILLSLLSWRK